MSKPSDDCRFIDAVRAVLGLAPLHPEGRQATTGARFDSHPVPTAWAYNQRHYSAEPR